MNMEIIVYRKGEPFTVLYDECDHELISGYKWCLVKGYVKAKKRGQWYTMHRLMLNPKECEFVDHINHNKSDNRRANLRICNRSENQRNKKPYGVSRYLGVSFNKRNGKFYATIMSYGVAKSLGYHHTAEEAARAYDKAARLYHGEFANPNFPA